MDKIEAPILAELELNGGDIVVAGAYKGDTVAFLREHHPKSMVFAYEPQIWAFRQLRERFSHDPRVHVFSYALGVISDGSHPMHEFGTDAGSLLSLPDYRTIDFVSVVDAQFMRNTQPALFFMNIEGYELRLIPYLLSLDVRPKCWLVQMHFKDRMAAEYQETLDSLEAKGYVREVIGKGWEFFQ